MLSGAGRFAGRTGRPQWLKMWLGVFSLPAGGSPRNFRSQRAGSAGYPSVIEEPSVVAGASFMARLAKPGGGFTAHADEPVMIGQMQILDTVNLHEARLRLLEKKAELMARGRRDRPGP